MYFRSRYDCRALNLTWINAKITFDHVGHAYLALFQVVSFAMFILNIMSSCGLKFSFCEPCFCCLGVSTLFNTYPWPCLFSRSVCEVTSIPLCPCFVQQSLINSFGLPCVKVRWTNEVSQIIVVLEPLP